ALIVGRRRATSIALDLPRQRDKRLTDASPGKERESMVTLRQFFSRLGLCGGLLAFGCSSPSLGKWDGPAEAAPTKIEQWSFGEEKAKLLESKHYHVYTTIKEDEVLDLLPQVMEGALSMYRQIARDIVGESNDRIDAFYAQCWAFAKFLYEGENGKYRPMLQKWLNETAAGTVFDPTKSHARAIAPWNRKAVKPMLEHYLGMDLND